jgi:integrase
MADLHFQKLAAILSWGVKQGWIDINPCTLVERLHHGSRLDEVWAWEDEGTFLAGARQDLVEGYLTGVWTGLREGDCVDLRWSQYDGEYIRRELEKRARPGAPPKRAMIPVGGPFKPILDAMERRDDLDPAHPSDRRKKSFSIRRANHGQAGTASTLPSTGSASGSASKAARSIICAGLR